jgi:HlyD family secretion protein
MSQSTVSPAVAEEPTITRPPENRPSRRKRRALLSFVLCVLLGAVAFGAFRIYQLIQTKSAVPIPTAKVQRGDLDLTVTAQGQLKGKNPEVLAAPMMGGTELHLSYLLKSGTPVKRGEVVVRFDTAEQEYKQKEAEADLAEAQQHILQAKAGQEAQDEEDRYALAKAQTDVDVAELDVRKNPLLASIVARQNDLALSAARDHLAQLKENLKNRGATNAAASAIEKAGRTKAEAQATTARQNIEAMTLRAHHDGYVAIRQNMNVQFGFFGMNLPFFQVGDTVNPGMAVAEIPDLKNWEIEANIGELDRGHIVVGGKVDVAVIAVPDEKFSGIVRDVGGTSGPPWNRVFACTVALNNSSPSLRPGMSTRLMITTDRLHDILWLPAQALFESGGRTFVYAKSGDTFAPKDVKLVRRSETRVVISGLPDGQIVALANPLESGKKPASKTGSALQGVGK